MNLTINLYLEDDLNICTIHDTTCNPFKVGDVIGLKADDVLFASEVKEYKQEFRDKAFIAAKLIEDRFNRKKVVIVEELKWADLRLLRPTLVTIDYYCKFHEETEEVTIEP